MRLRTMIPAVVPLPLVTTGVIAALILFPVAGCTPDAEEARAREVGSAAAATFHSTLAPRLMAAMQEGSPAHAVEFCAGAAETLTDSASRAAGFEVKRTSSCVRNPASAPDR